MTGVIGGSKNTFYKQIDGQKYDRSALRSAKRSQQGPRDGRISKADVLRLAKKLVDGGKYTNIEKATAALIRKDGNLTPAAYKALDHAVRSAGQNR